MRWLRANVTIYGPYLTYVICNFVFKIKSKLENSNVPIVISLHGVQV